MPDMVLGQACKTLSVTYGILESRCAATGSIQINVSGGSGNYQYMISGPVSTNYSSSNLITGLSAGKYLVTIKDVDSSCTYEKDSVTVPGNYITPNFTMTATGITCMNGSNGTISLNNETNGRSPFSYKIIAPSPSGVGTVNNTGIFAGLSSGTYLIQLNDSCGAIQTRSIDIASYSWFINTNSVTKISCDSVSVTFILKDSKNNVTPNAAFNGFQYGASVIPGDTTWFLTNTFTYLLGTYHTVNIFVKDLCGNIQSASWTDKAIPSVAASVSISNKVCGTFSATITGQINLTTPNYCVYDGSNTLISCNSTGIFNALPYGSYCIKITNSCYDTIITRCFTVIRPIPAVGTSVSVTQSCATSTATVTGLTNINNPNYCLYDAGNNLISCNTTGTFTNIPNGSNYCIKIANDPTCYDTTISRCFTIKKLVPSVNTTVSISNKVCAGFTATITGQTNINSANYCLYDSNNILIGCNATGVFNTTSYGSFCIKIANSPSCYDTTISRCFSVSKPIPSVASLVTISNKTCAGFTASISGQTNINNPNYCLYDSNNILISCNTTGVFNNVTYGSFCIKITNDPSCYDTTISRCFIVPKTAPAIGTTVAITNLTCSSFTASITGQTNVTNPYYCLYDSNNVKIACDSTGIFNNVSYGKYCIKFTNGSTCYDTTISRCFSVIKPIPSVNATVTISNKVCGGFTATITGQTNLNNPNYCIYDSGNNLVSCNTTGIFSNVPYGSYCIKIRNDSTCYDTTISRCFSVSKLVPSVGATVTISNQVCAGFTATITGQTNINNANYCIYNAGNNLVSCNTTGVFTSVPYGSYCIKIKNDSTCYDTTISRCFSVAKLVPALGNTITYSNKNCTTFTVSIAYNSNLNNPQYCLYDSTNTLIACNTSCVFNNVPYGSYCIKLQNDPACYDTVITRCFSLSGIPASISLSATKSCVLIGGTDLKVTISSGTPSYSISLYRPDNSLLQTVSTGSAAYTFAGIPNLSTGLQYKIVVTDQCGRKDSNYVTPVSSLANRVITLNHKCPSATWSSGSADVIININSNNVGGSIVPTLIYKNGSAVSISASSTSGYTYTFSDLGPATYIYDTYVSTCGQHLYDTVTVNPYVYPTLSGTNAYQCDNGSFTVNVNATNGVMPYMYEIFGSNPSSPNINQGPQANPMFSVNNGTSYSLVRLRVVDGCGNASLYDASILPLAQTIVYPSNSGCYNQGLTLFIDSVSNSISTWYKRVDPNDSLIVGTSSTLTIPNLTPADTGRYFVKTVVNNGCLVKYANYIVTGYCGSVLPLNIQLSGNKQNSDNQLYWNAGDQNIKEYELQRGLDNTTNYETIYSYGNSSAGSDSYIDKNPGNGNNYYRLKLTYLDGQVKYTNTVLLQNSKINIIFYPNPVSNELYISISNSSSKNYLIEFRNVMGQVLISKKIYNIKDAVISYPRTSYMSPGIYTVTITDLDTFDKFSNKVLYK